MKLDAEVKVRFDVVDYIRSVRNQTLDILRAVAVLLVFSRHSEGAPIVSHLGWVGVDLFFVLSGFLVSGLLFREYQQAQEVSSGRFLIRRGFKIYPQFYLLVAVTAIGIILGKGPLSLLTIAAEAGFFQNYVPGLWAHTWSLAVEEHFYILLTVGLAFLARRGGANPFQNLPRWILATCTIILGLRIATWYWHPQSSDYVHVFPSHLRMDSLLWGVLLSYFSVFRPAEIASFIDRFGKWLSQLSILLLAPVAFLDQSDPFIYTFGFSMTAMSFTLLLLSALHPRKAPGKSGAVERGLARLGQASYAFYLWHGPVLFADDRLSPYWAALHIPIPVLFHLTLTFGVTLAVAFLTTWLVEQPFLRWRDRWFPSRLRGRAPDALTRPQEALLAVPLAEPSH